MNVKELEATVRSILPGSAFIPICAEDALIYRAASGLPFEQFQQLNAEWIDKIGIDELGRSKWRKFSQQEKYDAAYNVINNRIFYEEIFKATNFPEFLTALREAVGGPEEQLDIIRKQLSVALKAAETFDNNTVATISKIKGISERLGIATDMSFNDHFWQSFGVYKADAILRYQLNTDYKAFHVAMTQLIAYDAEHRQSTSYETEHRRIVDEMVSLVRLQLLQLLKFADSWQERYLTKRRYFDNCCSIPSDDGRRDSNYGEYLYSESRINNCFNQSHFWKRTGVSFWENILTKEVKFSDVNPVTKKEEWYDLSLRDFEIAFVSILVASSSEVFSFYFGPEKLRIDSLLRQFDCIRALFKDDSTTSKYRCIFRSIIGSYNDVGAFVPNNAQMYNVFVHFSMPERISDPDHWGHLAWMFFEFMEENSSK